MLSLEKAMGVSMAMSYCLGDCGPGRPLRNHCDPWTPKHSKGLPPLLSDDFSFISELIPV